MGGSLRCTLPVTGSLTAPVSVGMSAATQSSSYVPLTQAAYARAQSPRCALEPSPRTWPGSPALQMPPRRASAPVDATRIATLDSVFAAPRPTAATPAPAEDALPLPPAVLCSDAALASLVEAPAPTKTEATAEDLERGAGSLSTSVGVPTPRSALSPGAGSFRVVDCEVTEATPVAGMAGAQVRESSKPCPATKMVHYGPAVYAGKRNGSCSSGTPRSSLVPISVAPSMRRVTVGPAQYEGMRRRNGEPDETRSSTADISPILCCTSQECFDVIVYEPPHRR